MFVILSHVFNKNLNINQTKEKEKGEGGEERKTILCRISLCWHKIQNNPCLLHLCVCRFFFQMWIIESVVQAVLGTELLYLTPTKRAGSTAGLQWQFKCPSHLSRRSSFAPMSLFLFLGLLKMKFGVTRGKSFHVFYSYAIVLVVTIPGEEN